MNDQPKPGPGPEDPSGIDEPHDVLAAEEFALPTEQPSHFPRDPTGIREAHDVLAAEEFAMPSPGEPGAYDATASRSKLPLALAVGAALAAAIVLRRFRS
jgi:hypothetical protein